MYTLTVFPQAKLQTGTGDDKRRVAPYATFGDLRTFSTFDELVQFAADNTISLNEYGSSDKCRPGQVHRNGSYFLRTKLMGLDIDDNLTLGATIEKLEALGYRYGIYTSFNHSEVQNKFRVILELEGFISDPSSYSSTWEALHREFLGIDTQCKDVARLYFHSNPETKLAFVKPEGRCVSVMQASASSPSPGTPKAKAEGAVGGWESIQARNKLPLEVRTWLHGMDEYGNEWTPAPGERSGLFYKLVKLCKERGYEKEWCDEKLGERLRSDPDYLASYGGAVGVDEKIAATLDQVFSQESRHSAPSQYALYELSNARRFVQAWIKSRGLVVTRGGMLERNGTTQLPKRALDTIILDYGDSLEVYKRVQNELPKDERVSCPRVSEKHLESALNEYIHENKQGHVLALQKRIQFNGDGSLSELKKFVRAICGREDEVDEAVLSHFIWQVKRKVFGLPVQYHLMPILTGPQGNGKSSAIKKLFEPLKDFVATPTLADLADKRHCEAYEANFIAFCDELEKANQTDVDGLKNFITADRQTYRPLYSNIIAECQQNCTAIGCTNRSLASLIYDPTGMRRFYEIATDPDMEASGGWALQKEVNIELLWRQVDENIPGSECYILPFKDQIGDKQESLRTKDPVELFLEESGALVVDPAKTIAVRKSGFYESYRQFCITNGHKPKASNWFKTAAEEKGIQYKKVRIEGSPQNAALVGEGYVEQLE